MAPKKWIYFNGLNTAFFVACVAGISKNFCKGKETGRECEKTYMKETKLWGGLKNKEQREWIRLSPFLHTPSPPLFFAHPKGAPSLARFFASLFDRCLEKGKEMAAMQTTFFGENLSVKEYWVL